jgi:hypothetical protein
MSPAVGRSEVMDPENYKKLNTPNMCLAFDLYSRPRAPLLICFSDSELKQLYAYQKVKY